jgi:branched-subunit amino acid transport protein
LPEPAVWLAILGGMLGTYLTRLSFILLVPPGRLPSTLRRGLRYIPPAVLSAIVLPELLLRNGALELTADNPRLMAGAVAAVVAWRTRNTWLTIASGMVTLWLLAAG